MNSFCITLFLLNYANCYRDYKPKIVITQQLDIQLNQEIFHVYCMPSFEVCNLGEVVLLLGRIN